MFWHWRRSQPQLIFYKRNIMQIGSVPLIEIPEAGMWREQAARCKAWKDSLSVQTAVYPPMPMPMPMECRTFIGKEPAVMAPKSSLTPLLLTMAMAYFTL